MAAAGGRRPAGKLAGVLFDLDGTLLDTLEDLADSTNRCLASLGFPGHPVQAYRYFVGDGLSNLARRTLPAERREDPAAMQALQELFNRDYHEHWADKTRPYEGVTALLEALSARGRPMAVLSNKPHAFTVEMVRHFFGSWQFAAVFGARESHPRKPDPAAALEAGAAMGLSPAQVLYAGDTSTDMQTARNAGMFAVGVLWGFRPRAELEQGGAQAVLSRPEELLGWL
jgi:phosphoglycolate phosphatase